MKSFTNIVWWAIAISLVGLVAFTLITGNSPFTGLDPLITTIVFAAVVLLALIVPSIIKKK